jgi:ATP-dependent exoDNAse (exonuclease V) alpha subunit
VHEIQDRGERIAEIARTYADRPEGTLVISPDNLSRMELNRAIHSAMQERGAVSNSEHTMKILTPRQDMTGVDRAWASQYEPGDVVRYAKGSRTLGIEAGEYATVIGIDRERNQLTIERENGQTLTYDPRRLQGVAVYRESERAFSEGDRVQFTAPDRERKIANRELGTIEGIDDDGNVKIQLDSGRELSMNIEEHPHLDYGYAVTSHSSQGATADRVLIHIDSDAAHSQLINSRLAYVSVSRARYDAQIYTNDASTLGKVLSREVSHAAAVEGFSEDAAPHAGVGAGSESQQKGPAAAESHGQAMAMEH